MIEEFSYSYSYSVSNGEVHFLDGSGERVPQNEYFELNPYATALKYVGTEAGAQHLKVIAKDNFRFTEKVDINYIVTRIPSVEMPPEEPTDPSSNENDILPLYFRDRWRTPK